MMNPLSTLQAQVRYQQHELVVNAEKSRLVRIARAGRTSGNRHLRHVGWRD
jgi:hypothetical protein